MPLSVPFGMASPTDFSSESNSPVRQSSSFTNYVPCIADKTPLSMSSLPKSWRSNNDRDNLFHAATTDGNCYGADDKIGVFEDNATGSLLSRGTLSSVLFSLDVIIYRRQLFGQADETIRYNLDSNQRLGSEECTKKGVQKSAVLIWGVCASD